MQAEDLLTPALLHAENYLEHIAYHNTEREEQQLMAKNGVDTNYRENTSSTSIKKSYYINADFHYTTAASSCPLGSTALFLFLASISSSLPVAIFKNAYPYYEERSLLRGFSVAELINEERNYYADLLFVNKTACSNLTTACSNTHVKTTISMAEEEYSARSTILSNNYATNSTSRRNYYYDSKMSFSDYCIMAPLYQQFSSSTNYNVGDLSYATELISTDEFGGHHASSELCETKRQVSNLDTKRPSLLTFPWTKLFSTLYSTLVNTDIISIELLEEPPTLGTALVKYFSSSNITTTLGPKVLENRLQKNSPYASHNKFTDRGESSIRVSSSLAHFILANWDHVIQDSQFVVRNRNQTKVNAVISSFNDRDYCYRENINNSDTTDAYPLKADNNNNNNSTSRRALLHAEGGNDLSVRNGNLLEEEEASGRNDANPSTGMRETTNEMSTTTCHYRSNNNFIKSGPHLRGGILPVEANFFLDAVERSQCNIIIESGVNFGGSTTYWCDYLISKRQINNTNATKSYALYTMDREATLNTDENFCSLSSDGYFQFLQGDAFNLIPRLLNKIVSTQDYLADDDDDRICLFLDGPKGRVAVRFAEQLLRMNSNRYRSMIKLIGIHDVHADVRTHDYSSTMEKDLITHNDLVVPPRNLARFRMERSGFHTQFSPEFFGEERNHVIGILFPP